jgi:uncharacterized protein HemX
MSSFFLADLPSWLSQKYFHTNKNNMKAYKKVLKKTLKQAGFEMDLDQSQCSSNYFAAL